MKAKIYIQVGERLNWDPSWEIEICSERQKHFSGLTCRREQVFIQKILMRRTGRCSLFVVDTMLSFLWIHCSAGIIFVTKKREPLWGPQGKLHKVKRTTTFLGSDKQLRGVITQKLHQTTFWTPSASLSIFWKVGHEVKKIGSYGFRQSSCMTPPPFPTMGSVQFLCT